MLSFLFRSRRKPAVHMERLLILSHKGAASSLKCEESLCTASCWDELPEDVKL